MYVKMTILQLKGSLIRNNSDETLFDELKVSDDTPVVGFFDPLGLFIVEAVLTDPDEALRLVHYLNGGEGIGTLKVVRIK